MAPLSCLQYLQWNPGHARGNLTVSSHTFVALPLYTTPPVLCDWLRDTDNYRVWRPGCGLYNHRSLQANSVGESALIWACSDMGTLSSSQNHHNCKENKEKCWNTLQCWKGKEHHCCLLGTTYLPCLYTLIYGSDLSSWIVGQLEP